MGKNKRYTDVGADWKAYTPDGKHFLFPTYAKGQAMRTAPKELESILAQKDPIGWASYYCHGNAHGYITTYLLNTNEEMLFDIAKRNGKSLEIREISSELIKEKVKGDMFTKQKLERVPLNASIDQYYNIEAKFVDLGFLSDTYIMSTRHDIAQHLIGKTPNKQFDIAKHFTVVDSIRPKIQFFPIPPKPNQLVKHGKGATEKLCKLDVGINLSEGCMANMLPSGYYNPKENCTYCYAYQNGLPFQTTLYNFDDKEFAEIFMKRLKEINSLYLQGTLNVRLGQNVEVNFPKVIRNIPGFVDTLPVVLEYFARQNSKGMDFRTAMPTKTPEFEKERAKLMKKIGLSQLVSIVDPTLETGIVNWGFDIDKRLEEAYKCHEAGVRTTFYIATNIVDGFAGQNDYAKKTIAFAKKHKMPWALLDIRVTRKEDAPLLINKSWKEAKFKSDWSFEGGGWRNSGQGYLVADRTHPDYLNDKTIKMCSVHVPEGERRCYGCGLGKAPQDI